MDDLKLYGKSENEIKGLVSTVEVFIQDIDMKFGIKKCGVIIMNRGKVKSTDGIVEYDRLKEQEIKDKFRNEYFRRAN